MGILQGSTRLRRYDVLGELDPDLDRHAAIQANAFQGFVADDTREKTAGWVSIRDWGVTDFEPADYSIGETLCLTLRIDSRKVPARLLKEECRKIEAEWKMNLGRENLSRAERDEIREMVHGKLIARALPTTRGIDFCWDGKEVLFWNAAESANELFRALFEKTFGLKLRPVFPYTLALRETEAIDALTPCSFVEA